MGAGRGIWDGKRGVCVCVNGLEYGRSVLTTRIVSACGQCVLRSAQAGRPMDRRWPTFDVQATAEGLSAGTGREHRLSAPGKGAGAVRTGANKRQGPDWPANILEWPGGASAECRTVPCRAGQGTTRG